MKLRLVLFMTVFNLISLADDAKLPSDSIYNIQSSWENQNGDSIQLKSFKGQNIIMTMVYTGCAHACPMMIEKIKEIEKAVVQAQVKDSKFVLASFDTVKDTPAQLKKYMEKKKFPKTAGCSYRPRKIALRVSYRCLWGLATKPSAMGIFRTRMSSVIWIVVVW